MANVLLAGVDTLAVGFRIKNFLLSQEEWAMLADAKSQAQGTMFDSGGTPVVLRGQTFSVNPKGGRGYEYLLVNDDVTVQLAERAEDGRVYPEVQITWRSPYLWRFGWRAAYTHVRDWLHGWAVVSGEKVSRADLCLDINLALPEVNLKANEVVSYAQTRSEFYIQHHLKGLDDTGYSFGKGSLKCRVYDKRIEIVHSNKAWFEVLWRKQGWDGVSPVTRVEFQARRRFLKSMQVETVEDLEDQLADLWKYFTIWVSLRDNGSDSNRRRWPVKSFWRIAVDAVPAFGQVTGVLRIAQRKPRVDSLSRLGRGVLVTLAALMQTDTGVSFQSAVGIVQERAKEWATGEHFERDVMRRAGRLAFMA